MSRRHSAQGRPSRSRRSGRHPDAEVVVVRLIDAAFEDLQALLRLDPQIVRWALKKMLLLERDPEAGEVLHGALIGFRRLVVGDRDGRVVWRVTHDSTGSVIVDVAEVWAVGARSNAEVYAEVAGRAARMAGTAPATSALPDVIERLSKVAAGLHARAEQPASTLPEWLIERLRRQVGMAETEIAALSLEQAVDTWTQWASKPQ